MVDMLMGRETWYEKLIELSVVNESRPCAFYVHRSCVCRSPTSFIARDYRRAQVALYSSLLHLEVE